EYFKKCQNSDERIIEQTKAADGPKFYKITVENWYCFGKFDGDKVQKSSLVWNGGVK
ncbi:MAG: hypothetical protein JWO61_284, partial [Candidatus Saccharibacteria bacterium]|nr:hypothetical protein [Candidatus Saccharibacteria bacterium]